MKNLVLIGLMLFSLSLVFALSCYDVQYTENPGTDNTFPSPYNGQTVTVEGIVTNNTYGTTSTYPTSTKFYISDPAGGPWSGLYIYVFGTGVQVGDFVTCTGAISEYYGTTEMIYGSGATVVINSNGNQLPEPVLISTSLMPYNSSTTLPPPTSPEAEPFESVLCKIENVTATSAPDTHDEFYVTDGSGPGQVDNACYLYGHHFTGITIGQHWDRIVGIVDYAYSMYGMNPRDDNDIYTTSNQDQVVVLPDAKLIGNFPNPFAGQTVIAYNLKSAQPVQIAVYNLKGQKVRTLVDGIKNAQLHNTTFDGNDDNGSRLSSGVYLYKMIAGNTVETRKLVIR
jgi:predicted extracellular nuclease